MKQLLTLLHYKAFKNYGYLKINSLLLLLFVCLDTTAQTTLVGLTSNGGAEGKGTAFSLTTTGTNFSVIKGFADWGKAPAGNLFKNDDGNFYGMTSTGGTFNYGSVFMMTPTGKVTILRQLDYTPDGAYPNGELIKGADGYLYGATTDGGTNGYGTIFKVSTTGDFTVIRSLAYSDGVGIYGHLILASDGNFYGITYRGGATGAGTIFKLTASGVYTVLHNMTATTDGSSSVTSLVEGKDGNLYGTANTGGANNYGTIFKVTKAGVFTTLKSLNGTTDGYYCQSDLIQATDGNFYGTCYGGGSNSSGTVFKITSTGSYTVIKNFVYSTDGGNPKSGLLQNSDGSFYGMTYAGGTKSSGTIYKLTSTNVFSVIHAMSSATEGGNITSVLSKGDDGKFYAMAQTGGTYNMGTAFSVTADGTLNVVQNFNGAVAGNAPYASFVKGADSAYYATTSNGGAFGYGTIIKICGGATSVLHSFKQATDGGNPKGKLLLANDGSFYGLTSTGGTNNYGTIFKMTPGGVFSVLYNFKNADGTTPLGSLIQATDGYLYGMASAGGANGYGTVFKINLSGTFTVVRNLVNSTDGSKPNGSLIQAKDGNLYGMTFSSARIFKLTTGGAFTILHTFQNSDGAYPYGSLIQGTDGNLYGTCSEGGSNSYGTVFQCTLSDNFKVLHNFLSASGGQTPKGSLLQGTDGTLYGTTSNGGTYKGGTIFKMATNGNNYTELRQMNIRTDGGNALGDLIFAPLNNLVANAQSVSVNEDANVKITLTGLGSLPLAFTVVNNPAHGKISGTAPNITYKPYVNYNGTDQFSFAVSVGCITSAPAIISINVKPVADTPVLSPIGNQTVTKDSALKFRAKATDADSGQIITYSLIGAPTGAKINASNGSFNWTPTTAGTYSFKVRATDNGTPPLYDEEQITVTVTNNFAFLKSKTLNLNATVFPNPVHDKLNITLSKPLDELTLRLIDINGKIVMNKTVKMQGSLQTELNVSSLTNGYYIVQLQSNFVEQEIKILKQ